ncbi:hypothetical protein ACFX1S_009410 [Malus domestica]
MPLPLREPVVAFGSIAMHAVVVGAYFVFGIVAGAFNIYANDQGKDRASGCNESDKWVGNIICAFNRTASNLYFTSVTLSTVGYGDIVPRDGDKVAMLLTTLLMILGYYIVSFLIAAEVDRLGCWLLMRFNERRRGFIRFYSACLCGPILIASGVVMIRYMEEISWADSFYLSVASVTTTGYGDKHFKTLLGKCFASIWLLVSTILSSKSAQFLFDETMRIKRVRACGDCGTICHTCVVADLTSQIHAERIG